MRYAIQHRLDARQFPVIGDLLSPSDRKDEIQSRAMSVRLASN